MKVVINGCYGGFNPSEKAKKRYAELSGLELCHDVRRDDQPLVQVIEELGKDASGSGSSLKVVVIPDSIDWEISSYEGIEWVYEPAHVWG